MHNATPSPKTLSTDDKANFEQYLSFEKHTLCAYAFANIFLWKALYDIFWVVIDDNLCVFFEDKTGCFLYLPPLGRKISNTAVKECFQIMSRLNKNSPVSRIENVSEGQADFFRELGYNMVQHHGDYLCKRSELAELKGSRFKKKRAEAHFFTEHFRSEYLPYSPKDKDECLRLFLAWVKERSAKHTGSFYQNLLEDNFRIFKAMLDYYAELGYVGRIIRVDQQIRAMTFGYPLNPDCFVVVFEVCDLGFRGIAQYIFKTFCQELSQEAVNIMDDSGLENLKLAKLSYHPFRIEYSYCVKPA